MGSVFESHTATRSMENFRKASWMPAAVTPLQASSTTKTLVSGSTILASSTVYWTL